ncbi:AEC family transporter [Lederbergia sp. NSJ-179]|uniref:AEC family transporter n=1 Tax=Lederbergia sp. NSJ-179 TaxID=2931402 RepID=UPI001FD08850|nr:AEC family transporter [Lederbergia sp. NSJ-179]MCJ7842347.1 AEC family transporter [Lederbergia sp. NSJ-179]
MNALVSFAQEMIMLYGFIFLGYIARKKGILNRHADQVMTQLVLYITLPALILASMDISFSVHILKEMLVLCGLSIYILFLACLLAKWIRKKAKVEEDRKKVVEALIIFGNQGFIGYAVSYALFGDQGIVYATMFNIPYLVLIWTYGIFIFVQSKHSFSWSQIFLNPGLVSTLIGLIVFIFPFHWPLVILGGLESVGKMTVPLSMLLIGSIFVRVRTKDVFVYIKNRYVWLTTGMRLIIIPICLLPFTLFSIPFALMAIAVLVSGMPAAPTVSMYAQKFGGDVPFASITVFLTTLASIITIPSLYILLSLIYV